LVRLLKVIAAVGKLSRVWMLMITWARKSTGIHEILSIMILLFCME
jgi:hypothetical protein